MPTETEQPIDVRPWMSDAEYIARAYAEPLELRAAILDDWNSAPGLRSPRIIYDTPYAEHCSGANDCATCPVFRVLGADDDRDGSALRLRATLCRATTQHHAILPSQQTMLNCKTRAQYAAAYIAYIVACCTTRDALDAELDWVRGFRLVYDASCTDDPRRIITNERVMKIPVIHGVTREFVAQDDTKRLEIMRAHVRKWLPDALEP